MIFVNKLCSFVSFFYVIQIADFTFPDEQKKETKGIIDLYINIWPMQCDKNEGSFEKRFIREINFQNGLVVHSGSLFISKIYAFNYSINQENDKMCKLNSFFLCLNCEFARWTKSSLFYLINNLPWYHQTELIYRKNETEFEAMLQSMNVKKLQHLVKFVNKFINILSSLIDLEPYPLLSNETIVLQSLFEIKLKITYDSKTKINKIFTILEALVIINALQSFILTNCQGDTPYYETTTSKANHRIFGYSIKPNVPYQITLFLNKTKHFYLDSHLQCSDEEIYLRKLVVNEDNTPELTKMSDEIGSTNIFLNNKKIMTVKEMIISVKQIRNIINLHFYFESIFNAILKIIHQKVQSFFSKLNKFEQDTVACITNLVKKLESNMFPTEFLNYFNRLLELMLFESEPMIVSYKISKVYEEQFKNIRLQMSKIDDNYTIFYFVEDLIKYKYDFMCSKKIFIILQKTFRNQFTPFNVDTDKMMEIRSSVNQNDDIQNRCNFIDYVYIICLQLVKILKDIEHLGEKNSSKISARYELMKKYFLWAINGGSIQDDNFLIMAYKCAIILVNKKYTYAEMKYFMNNFERPVYLIMTDLSDYGIKYCSALHERKSYMLYDNVDLYGIYNDDTIKVNISQSLHIPAVSLDTMPTHDQFDLELVYLYLVKPSGVIEKYKDIIKFYWKGSARSMEEIYIYITSSITLNPYFLFEFYDFFFKFYIAAFYYEIIQFFGVGEKPNENVITEFNLCVNNFTEASFPENLKPFIYRLKEAALFPTESFNDFKMFKDWLIKHFKHFIEHFFIVIEQNTRIKYSSSNANSHNKCIENINDINADVSDRVNIMLLDFFSLLRTDFIKY